MSSQSQKSGKAISLFLSDQVTYMLCFVAIQNTKLIVIAMHMLPCYYACLHNCLHTIY